MRKAYILMIFITSTFLYANGSSIFAVKCASCHGSHGEKSALEKSKAVAGQDPSITAKQIRAYKSGALNQYGMGGAMKNMVKSLNDNEINEVANYISTLK
jgi:cytochrome c